MNKKHIDIRIEQCISLSKASNCSRRKIGALLLDPDRNVIIADGYNGAPRGGSILCGGESHCLRDGCKNKDLPPIESGTRMEIGCHHAEMNVICNAAANGTSTSGAWLFVTASCCLMCAKIIHHAGITKVNVIANNYTTEDGMLYLQEHNVDIEYVRL